MNFNQFRDLEIQNAEQIVQQFLDDGAETVFIAALEDRFYVGLEAPNRVRGTDVKPPSVGVSSTTEVREAFEQLIPSK